MSKKQSEEQRFWSGYALGAFSAGIAAYAFGTKTGRTKVKKLIEIIESHKDPSQIADSLSEILPDVLKSTVSENDTDIHHVISKMKNISSEETKSKKFITK
jgi:hemerythrin